MKAKRGNTGDKQYFPPRAKVKLWVEAYGDDVFGQGRMKLLEAIDETGSISQAAVKLGMSYRAAWGKVTNTEKRLGIKLLLRRPGNKECGTALTATGRRFLEGFQKFNREATIAVDDLFKDYVLGLIEDECKEDDR
ncbi:MAG: LysR family transcriptional regulator [Heliobacteriaceae bacterium]|nr:LysR family transcriptional regulator [Heliobacteriaceae bacterium]MDD4587312.1 LysR family transcriptional regulator [Heliobacteriaceae bacterium]